MSLCWQNLLRGIHQPALGAHLRTLERHASVNPLTAVSRANTPANAERWNARSCQPRSVITRRAVVGGADAVQQPVPQLTCKPGDVIRATSDDGSELFLEVLAANLGEELVLAAGGVVYASMGCGSKSKPVLELQPKGWQLSPHDEVVRAFPGWSVALAQHQEAAALPGAMTAHAPAVVSSASRLEAAVQLDVSFWCDGTAPHDPPMDGLSSQLLCGGEIASLLAGKRGVVMVQLQVGWDKTVPVPVLKPLALHMLRKALLRPDLSIFISKAPGGLGLTAIMAAKVEPFRSWALHLASFGAQAALVADSPYYKLLIGRVMGYKDANIIHHIQTTSGRNCPSDEVVAAVTLNMNKLSKKKPQLPWTQHTQQQGGRRGARRKAN